MKLLLIEDDEKLAEHLGHNLKEHGFAVKPVSSVSELKEMLSSSVPFEFILMDRLLGATDSKVFLPDIKKKWPMAPIIVLSAISTPNVRTDLINLGADDYLGKPFSTQELIARMRSLLRRSVNPVGNFLQVEDLVVDLIRRVISVGEKAENLPTREFALLRTLAQDPARVWSKDELLDYVWGHNANVDTNVVESTIANVRRKLSEIGASVTIRNMRNAGYWIAK